MYKKIWVLVISVILILTISGSVVAKDLSAKIELKDGNVIMVEIEEPLTILVKTKEGMKEINIEDIVYLQMNFQLPTIWKLQAPWWLITGGPSPRELNKFQRTLEKSLEKGSFLSGYSGHFLVERVEKHLESIRRSNTIFLILPKTEEFEALKELREKYLELFPISSEEFNKFSPLIYLTYDIKTEKMRGIIIADKVDASLAKMLLEEDLPLNTFFRYENGQLKKIEGK